MKIGQHLRSGFALVLLVSASLVLAHCGGSSPTDPGDAAGTESASAAGAEGALGTGGSGGGDSTAARIDIEKSTNGFQADRAPGPSIAVGAEVLWEYVVTNTGGVQLTNIKVTDDQGVRVSCPGTSLALAPGASMVCRATGVAKRGQYVNVGRAEAPDPNGASVIVFDEDSSHYLGAAARAGIEIEKSTNGFQADRAPGPSIAVGAEVLWEYVVTNTGGVQLTNIKVTDDQGVRVSCPGTSLALAPGASMVCRARGVAKLGQYVNVGRAEAPDPNGASVIVFDEDSSHYFGSDSGSGNGTGQGRGCGLGYWKNHLDSWPPTGYSPHQTVRSVFALAAAYSDLASSSLLEAMQLGGGPGAEGAARILLGHAVAALLNAAHPQLTYPRSKRGVIGDVDSALASGDRETMLSLKDRLEADNEAGCALN